MIEAMTTNKQKMDIRHQAFVNDEMTAQVPLPYVAIERADVVDQEGVERLEDDEAAAWRICYVAAPQLNESPRPCFYALASGLFVPFPERDRPFTPELWKLLDDLNVRLTQHEDPEAVVDGDGRLPAPTWVVVVPREAAEVAGLLGAGR